jgi:hypothetical protein
MSQQQIEDDLIDAALLHTLLEIIQKEEEGEEEEEKEEEEESRQSRRLAKGTGQDYLDQLLQSGHEERIKAVLRMSKTTFISLKTWLVKHSQLTASMHISVELKLAIFLHITSRPASQRDTMERYSVGNRVVSQ